MVWLHEKPYPLFSCMSRAMRVPLPTPEGPTTTRAQGGWEGPSPSGSGAEDSAWPMAANESGATHTKCDFTQSPHHPDLAADGAVVGCGLRRRSRPSAHMRGRRFFWDSPACSHAAPAQVKCVLQALPSICMAEHISYCMSGRNSTTDGVHGGVCAGGCGPAV